MLAAALSLSGVLNRSSPRSPRSFVCSLAVYSVLCVCVRVCVYQAHGGEAASGENVYMLTTAVTSRMIAAMAKKEGFQFDETLTGFKWLGNRTEELRRAGKTVLFSTEEAIGFCVGDIVKDKDGICAAAVFAEMAGALARAGRTVTQHMRFLYDVRSASMRGRREEGEESEEGGRETAHRRMPFVFLRLRWFFSFAQTYGHFRTNNRYVFVDDPAKTAAIFSRLRNEGAYWFRLGRFPIRHIRDLTKPGLDTTRADGKPTLPTSSSHMLTFFFENGCASAERRWRQRGAVGRRSVPHAASSCSLFLSRSLARSLWRLSVRAGAR